MLGLLSVAATIFGGWQGLAGVGLGVAASAVSLVSLSLFTGMIAKSRPPSGSGTMLTMTMLLLKLPALGICAYLAVKLGYSGLFSFLGAVGLVYFFFVWFVVATPRTE
ncbi:MAG: hypothetical protein U0R49_06490 [Fimbriimonadales bacterium]